MTDADRADSGGNDFYCSSQLGAIHCRYATNHAGEMHSGYSRTGDLLTWRDEDLRGAAPGPHDYAHGADGCDVPDCDHVTRRTCEQANKTEEFLRKMVWQRTALLCEADPEWERRAAANLLRGEFGDADQAESADAARLGLGAVDTPLTFREVTTITVQRSLARLARYVGNSKASAYLVALEAANLIEYLTLRYGDRVWRAVGGRCRMRSMVSLDFCPHHNDDVADVPRIDKANGAMCTACWSRVDAEDAAAAEQSGDDE